MRKISLWLFASLMTVCTVQADDRFAKVEITSQKLSDQVYMLKGAGGNLGALVGPEGILVVDYQYRPLAERITAALAELGDAPVKYVINTHLHGDHTGSNAWLRTVNDTTVFAHENVHKRMAGKDDVEPASLPVVTYESGVKFHFNGETVHVWHIGQGHTDGDSVVWFENANVLHTGDLLFNQRFPYVDKNSGGSVAGVLHNLETIINKIDDKTQIIPGHGDIADRQQVQQNYDMIKETAAFVAAQKAKGMTVEQVVEAGLDEKWATWGAHFITEERWIKTLY